MKLDWLDDLLAVVDTGSLNDAASKRFLTQPAFSRRIQAIERHVGVELFDRTCKPVQARASVARNENRIRQLAKSLRELSKDLAQGDKVDPLFVLACPHSISTAVAPALIKAMSSSIDSRIRLRSANRDDCYSLLLTGDADAVVMYQTVNESNERPGDFTETHVIGHDTFIPVANAAQSTGVVREFTRGKIEIVSYPENVFLGRVFNERIMPQLLQTHEIRWIAETGLTPAALQFALSGVGIAWVPRSLARRLLDTGELRDLSDTLPALLLEISALQLKQEVNEPLSEAWQWILSHSLPLQT